MCTVSAVSGAFQGYPGLQQNVTPSTWADIKKILALCEKIDAALGEPDCIDPEKAEWMRSMEARVRGLEAKSA